MKKTNIVLSLIAMGIIGGTGYMLTHKSTSAPVKAGEAKTAKIRVNSDTYMPMSAAQPITSQSKGFEEQILFNIKDCLAKQMGFQSIEYDVVQSSEEAANIAALNNKSADLVIGGWSAKAERFKSVDFTNPYYVDNVALVGNDELASVEDLLKAGKTIGVQSNTNGEVLAIKVAKAIGANVALVKSYPKIDELKIDFLNKNLGYVIVDNSYSDDNFADAKKLKDSDVTHVAGVENKGAPTVMFTRKGSKLTAYINQCMRESKVGEMAFIPKEFRSMNDIDWKNYKFI